MFEPKRFRPRPGRRRYLTIYVTPELHAKAEEYAERCNLNLDELVIQALEHVVEQLELQRIMNV